MNAKQEWQPIESAPKDVQWLLLARQFDFPGDWRIKMGYRSTDIDSSYGWKILGASWEPTHWMPLPPPPAIDASQSEPAGKKLP